jgi:hypothetical protein
MSCREEIVEKHWYGNIKEKVYIGEVIEVKSRLVNGISGQSSIILKDQDRFAEIPFELDVNTAQHLLKGKTVEVHFGFHNPTIDDVTLLKD